MGYAFAKPVVARAMEVHRVVRAVGWAGAAELLDESFAGWEADFLGPALALLKEADQSSEQARQARLLGIGARRG